MFKLVHIIKCDFKAIGCKTSQRFVYHNLDQHTKQNHKQKHNIYNKINIAMSKDDNAYHVTYSSQS